MDHDTNAALILKAAIDTRQWEAVMATLCEQFNAPVAALCEWDFADCTGDIVHHAGYRPDFVRAYRAGACEHNRWLASDKHYAPGQVCLGDDVVAPECLRESRFFRQWLEPQGLFHRLAGVVSRDDGGRMVYVETLRAESQGPFDAAEQQCLTDLLPHFREALACNDHLYRLAINNTILDELCLGVLVVDASAHLITGNRAGLEETARTIGLTLRAQQVRVTAAKENERLRRMIEDAASPRPNGSEPESPTLQIDRGDELPPLLVTAMPLARTLRRIVGQPNRLVVLRVTAPERIGKLPERRLRCDFGLTEAERRVARLVAEGQRLNQAAEQLGISFNTARAHMKRVYAKTETQHQSGFVRKLYAGLD